MQTSLLREQKITVAAALVADNKGFWQSGKWER